MKKITNIRRASLLLAALLVQASASAGAPWTIDWWTVDGGGEVFTAGGDWQLSGTIGQWDSTAHSQVGGGAWQISGGFWSIAVTGSDEVFRDGFE